MKNCLERIYGEEFTAQEIAEAVANGRLLSMEMEFNQNCNFHCVYCYAADNALRPAELNTEEFLDLIGQAHELGARKIIILGGEPLLYPNLLEMIRFIRGLGMEVELFTNGSMMTPELARQFFELRVRLVLKMNTRNEELQDSLAGRKGAYGEIQEALRLVKEAGYPAPDRPLGVSSIICRQNIEELPALWEWLRDQGILPYFEMITPQGEARSQHMLDPDPSSIEEFFHRISELDRTKYGRHWDPKPPLVGGECLRHQFSCAVNSEGFVQSCVGITIPLGNVREQRLKEILRDSEVVQDLKNYRNMIKGPCGECAKLEVCYGCRGTAYQMTGDYLASDPLCWQNLEKGHEITYLPVEASRVVPHQPPMLLLDRLLEVKERASVCEMTVRPDMIFVDGAGKLDDACYPELISQAIAAQEGFRRMGSQDTPQEGFLLGVKKMEISGVAQVGDTLRIEVFKTARYGEFGIIDGTVFRGEELIARGELKVWQKDATEAVGA